MTHEHENDPDIIPSTPDTPVPPFLDAAASIRACAAPERLPDLDALADRLERALYSDCIYDPDDTTALLAVQGRAMDALFHAMLQHGMSDRRFPDVEKLRVAIQAQRQSAMTIDRLKRQQSREKNFEFRISMEMNKRNEGRGKT